MQSPARVFGVFVSTLMVVLGCVLTFWVAIPTTAHAQLVISDLVTCGDNVVVSDGGSYFEYTGECDVCDFQRLLQRILSFLIAVMTAVAALLFANAGVLYVTSPANPAAVSKAHKIFMNTLVGVLIILSAYLLIDFGMKALLGGERVNEGRVNNIGPWNEILCYGEEDSYKVEKLETTTIGAETYELPPIAGDPGLTCAQKSGYPKPHATRGTPNPTCNDGYKEVDASDGKCCVREQLDSSCTASGVGSGRCYTFDACPDIDGAAVTDECGEGLVCCATPKSKANPDGEYDCSDMASLQEEFGGAGPVNGPGLDAMIACYKNDPKVASLLSSQTIYTYELSNDKCNYTNGNRVCGSCAHSVGSCHYGAGTGLGALAADFNANGSERTLYDALKAVQSKCGGKVHYESSHTHISLAICPKL